MSEQLKVSTAASPSETTSITSPPFSTKRNFPIGLAVRNKPGRKKNESSKGEEEWIENILEKPDIMYTTPGKRDTIFVGMDCGKWEQKQKQ